VTRAPPYGASGIADMPLLCDVRRAHACPPKYGVFEFSILVNKERRREQNSGNRGPYAKCTAHFA